MSVLQSFGAGPINQRMEAFSTILTLRGKHVTFQRRNDNVTAIKTLYQWLQDFNQIPNEKTQNEKNNEKSKNLRLKGNKMFENRTNLTNAIDLYNQSICWAEHNNGEELAIGFANRSAVYFEWKKYEICLENINLAVEAGYPQRLMEKLNQRKADCIKLMQEELDNKSTNNTTARKPTTHHMDVLTIKAHERRNFQTKFYSYDFDRNRTVPKLSLDANPKVPFIVDCLEMQTNSRQGRYIITKKDLKPGQIISIEEPFMNSLTTGHRYRKCANCFAENCLNLIPCKSCTCTMFCSQKCLTEAEQGFHQFECPIAEYIWSQCEEFALTLRLVVETFTTFDSIQELIEFRKENKNANVTVFSFDHTKCLSDKERYSQVDNLLTNADKRVYSDMFMRCCKVAIFYHYLIEQTKFAEMLKTEQDRDTLISVIMQHTQITSVNSFNCNQYDDVDLDAFMEFNSLNVFARGIYPFSSLFNHSCAPNVNTVSVGTKIVTYVTRAIRNNSEVLGCYKRINHLLQPKQSRIGILLQMYHFVCKCEACENDFPEVHDDAMLLGNISDEGNNLADMSYINLSKELGDVDKFCSILQKYSKRYPCFRLYRIGLNLHRALTLKFGNLSTEIEISLRDNHIKYGAISH